MSLRLEIISAQREQLGNRARFVVGEAGCRIGRSLDNDWALPDVARFLSGHHASIHYRGGEYFLEDTSSNGTYVNESVAPLGRRGTRALLHAGDVLRLGDYRILVHIDEAPPPPLATPDPQLQADMTVDKVNPLRDVPGRQVMDGDAIDFSALIRTAGASDALRRMGTARQSADADLGDALNIESLLPDIADARMVATNPGRQEGSTLTQNVADEADLDGTMARLAEQDRLARLRTAARARLDASNRLPTLDARSALEAFCRGAGIDPGQLPLQDEAQAMQLAGRLLREALLGLKEILRAQQAFVHRNGIEREVPEGRSPLDASIDEYLAELMIGHEKHRHDAVMRLRDQFAHAGAHATAVDPAMRGALEQFLGHLAPERLAAGGDAASWNRYREVYGNLLQARGGQLPHLFLEALAQAYQQALGSGAG